MIYTSQEMDSYVIVKNETGLLTGIDLVHLSIRDTTKTRKIVLQK